MACLPQPNVPPLRPFRTTSPVGNHQREPFRTPPIPACVLAARSGCRSKFTEVGIDNVAGYVTSIDGLPTTTPALIQPEDLADVDAAMILDVRNRTEHSAGHVPGAHQLNGGRVMWHLDELPTEGTIVTYCQSGLRNFVAASALRRAGYDIVELDGSYSAWNAYQQARQDAPAGK